MSRYRGGGGGGGGSHAGSNISAVFYAETYHPIQAGSIDGTDVLPHDNAVYRALLCSSAGLYDPNGDPKVIGDPYCTLFVGHLSPYTTEDSLRKAMSRYGRVKNLRLVRHIVTGASRCYAFIEYETEREMRHAYEDAHHTIIDDSEVIVDFNRQRLMPGWIPRRLGGGLGGKKESGQLRFGGRERPFRAPLRPIPWDDLKRLGIPLPPEGRYMSRSQIPPLPRLGSPVKDQMPAMNDADGSSLYRSSEELEKCSADQQFEHRRGSESFKRPREKTSQGLHYDEHTYNSDKDKFRHKNRRSYESSHDYQRHRESSPLRDHNVAVTEMTETSSYYASDSAESGSSEEYVGYRWSSEPPKRQRETATKVESRYDGVDEDDKHGHHHGLKSSHDHQRWRKRSHRHERRSDTGDH